MKKLLVLLLVAALGASVFAGPFSDLGKAFSKISSAAVTSEPIEATLSNSDRYVFEGVMAIAGAINPNGVYEIIDIDTKNDTSTFSFTWIQELKTRKTNSYVQFKSFFTVSSEEGESGKNLKGSVSKNIYSRAVNSDGSEVQDFSGTWREAENITNKKKILASLAEMVAKDILDALEQTSKDYSPIVIFLNERFNLTFLDTDMLGKLAMAHKDLCGNPGVVLRLSEEKTEIWFKNYVDSIVDTKVKNKGKLYSVKESDIKGYKYKAVLSFPLYKSYNFSDAMKKEGQELQNQFNATMELKNKTLGLATMTEMDSLEIRKRRFHSEGMRVIFVNFYSNDINLIEANQNDIISFEGKFKKANLSGKLIKELTSIDVYE